MSSEVVAEVKNEEATEPLLNEIIETTNEEQPTEQIKEEATITAPIEQTKEENETQPIPKAKAKPKAQPKARTVKVVLVECEACKKKMLPKSLKHTHTHIIVKANQPKHYQQMNKKQVMGQS